MWLRHSSGYAAKVIFQQGSIASGFSNEYSFSTTSSDITLTVLNVNQSQLAYLFRCIDRTDVTELKLAALSLSASSKTTFIRIDT